MVRSLPILQERSSTLEPAPFAKGPCERALDELWPTARARVWTLRYWRESLHLWRRFHLRPLSLGQLRIAVPSGQVPDCDACTEVCCTGENAVVSLRFRDMARLLDAGLEAHIVMVCASAPQDRPKHSWARREAEASVFGRSFPVLARYTTGTCALLTTERSCGAWPHWPLSCARYPFALDLQRKVIFWARGCGSPTVLAPGEAAPRVRALALAVVEAYNERLRDAVLLAVAHPELEALGLWRFLREPPPRGP